MGFRIYLPVIIEILLTGCFSAMHTVSSSLSRFLFP